MACSANGSAVEYYYILESAVLTAATISAAAADDSFNDSATGFVTAGFAVGNTITVSGFTGTAANNAKYKIATVTAGKITVTKPDGTVATNIVDDLAGESVTITMEGSIPAYNPAFLPIRFNTASVARNTTQIDSNEINDQRQRPVSRQGTYSTQGEIVSEMSDDSFDGLLEVAMQGTWAANVLKVGDTERSFAILERHTDIVEDYVYQGCRINALSVSSAIDAPVVLTFGVIGTSASAYTVPTGSTFGTMSTSDVMVTSQGFLKEDANTIGYATALEFSLNNGMEATFALFQRAAFCVSNGVLVATGTLSAYLKDGALYAKFLNETATKLEVQFTDGTNTRTFLFPKVIYTQASKGTSGPGAIIPQYTFSAGYDSTEATTIKITRSV